MDRKKIFKEIENGNFSLQDADEKLVEKPKTQVQKPIQTPSVGVEEIIKKEVVKSSSGMYLKT